MQPVDHRTGTRRSVFASASVTHSVAGETARRIGVFAASRSGSVGGAKLIVAVGRPVVVSTRVTVPSE